jgi:hypothetical protein
LNRSYEELVAPCFSSAYYLDFFIPMATHGQTPSELKKSNTNACAVNESNNAAGQKFVYMIMQQLLSSTSVRENYICRNRTYQNL